jgi:predicted TIM-barrel fold metal-dependent hydrolase
VRGRVALVVGDLRRTDGVKAIAEIAPDNVMWGSDYPHRDRTWPCSHKVIEEQSRRVYGLD